MNDDRISFFNLMSGKLYDITMDEYKYTDDYQVPLTALPSGSCKKCYGRGYTGRDINKKCFIMCSCMGKLIDRSKLGDLLHNHK